ncbi:MAG: cytochrome c peroxidase [bacterium]|nr:cytochrome c peroxidase [bacterium]
MKRFLAALVGCFLGFSLSAQTPLFSTPPRDLVFEQANQPLIDLGRQLFFDPRLSGNDQLACASCHVPELGFGDGQAKSRGVAGTLLGRHTPHLNNLEPQGLMFWDGRVKGLAEQALGPISNPQEMGMPLDQLVPKLMKVPGYQKQFDALFGSGTTPQDIGRALAAFEATLVSRNAPLDRYLAGDPKALSPSALRGLKLFGGKAGCGRCHSGPNLTDGGFHNIGLIGDDPGRFALTSIPVNQGAFKTPGLRNVALSAPYMHDGSLGTLGQVVDYYNRGGDSSPHQSPLIEALHLSAREQADLVAFLEALSDPIALRRPNLPGERP